MKYLVTAAPLFAALVISSANPVAAGEAVPVLKNRSIGYAITEKYWAVYQTAGAKVECPHGLNSWGPREQFKALFPNDGTPRGYVETAMARESETWFPHADKDQFPFYDAEGNMSYGMNLDGKMGPHDFTNPDGDKGIDNQLYRAIGCLVDYRDPQYVNQILQDFAYNRFVIELSGVDNLTNDNDVTLTTYRGLDPLLRDASGNNFLPHGTQRVDERWGKEFIRHFHGKIANGVLETNATDISFPANGGWDDLTVQAFRDGRWHLRLTPDSAEGVVAGYVDVDEFYRQLNETVSTHHQSYGQLSSPSLYRALRRLADAYPNPKTGQNTAISAAQIVRLEQVFVKHPGEETAADGHDGRDASTAKVAGAGQ